MIGKTISHYKILEKIGSGGMGVIYKAQDLKLDRFVALKFLPPHLTTREDDKQRFIHEAKAASALQHNNICNIHEIDETEDGQLFICMDYYEGDTLDKRIKDKPLPIDEANDISIQIAQGLAKAHEKEIIHRDIKPGNIMLTSDGVVKILDFGLAKLSTQTKLTKESTTLGTVSYMSPEQAKGEEVDYRTDIWSSGVILYEILTGQLPFKGEYESAVIYSILNDTQEPVTGLRTGVPMELERIISKCLQKNPANRYQHVDELIVDLRSIKRESESTSIPTKIENPTKRSKLIKMSVAVLSILILIVAGYYFILEPDKSEKTNSIPTKWENSIAVLPFENISNDPDQDYFCDGMTDQIISNIGRLSRIKIIPYQSVKKFKNSDKTISEIGEELNVAYVLVSSFRKFGERIRVTPKLIKTENELQVWSDDYNKEYKTFFDLQDQMVEAIASKLLENLSPQEKIKIKTNRPNSNEANEYYLQGRYIHYNRVFENNNKDEFFKSERMFKKSIELDPNFADAYASLVDLYDTYYHSFAKTEKEKNKYKQLQKAYLDTAYQLNPNSAEVNYAKATVHNDRNEIEEAFNCYRNAININPNNDMYYFELGWFLNYRGCTTMAIRCVTKAIDLNPVAPYYNLRGILFDQVGDYNKAKSDYKKAFGLSKEVLIREAYWILLVKRKRYNDAKIMLDELKVNYPEQDLSDVEAIQYAIDGEREKALNIDLPRYYKLLIYLLLEMKEESLNLLDDDSRLQKLRRSNYNQMTDSPICDFLRDDPRFQEILAKHKELYEENLRKYGDIDI